MSYPNVPITQRSDWIRLAAQAINYLLNKAVTAVAGVGDWLGYKVSDVENGVAFHSPTTGAYAGIFVDQGSGSIYCQNAAASVYFTLGGDLNGNSRIPITGSNAFEFATHPYVGTAKVIAMTGNSLTNAASDAAAATAGVPVGGLYRNGSAVMIRVA